MDSLSRMCKLWLLVLINYRPFFLFGDMFSGWFLEDFFLKEAVSPMFTTGHSGWFVLAFCLNLIGNTLNS